MIIGWEQAFFGKQEEKEKPEQAGEGLLADTGQWKPTRCDLDWWAKTIRLPDLHGYCYWLCMDTDGSWCLYRAKVKE